MYNDVDFIPSLRKNEQKEKDIMSLQSQIRV